MSGLPLSSHLSSDTTFADIDHELRCQGPILYRFTHVKCWSVSPIVRNNEPPGDGEPSNSATPERPRSTCRRAVSHLIVF